MHDYIAGCKTNLSYSHPHVMHALHTKMWILSGFGQSTLPVHIVHSKLILRDLQTNKLQTPTNRKLDYVQAVCACAAAGRMRQLY